MSKDASLTYGAQVNIQHVHSGLFITLCSSRAKQDGALKVKLGPDSPNSGFTIMPGYKSSVMGDVVQYGHGMTLLNDELKSYLHIYVTPSNTFDSDHEHGLISDGNAPWWNPNNAAASEHHHPYVDEVLECNGLNKATVAVVRPYRLRNQDVPATSIKGGDAVTLYSTESDRYLAVTKFPGRDEHEVSLRASSTRDDAEENELIDTSLFWRIHLVEHSGKKSEEPGGSIEMRKNAAHIRLCHLHTGLYLAIKDTDAENPDIYVTEEFMDKATVLSLQGFWHNVDIMGSAESQEGRLFHSGGQAFLGDVEMQGWISCEIETRDSDHDGHADETQPLSTEVIPTEVRDGSLGAHAFRVDHIPGDTLSVLRDAKSCIDALQAHIAAAKKLRPVSEKTIRALEKLRDERKQSASGQTASSNPDKILFLDATCKYFVTHGDDLRDTFLSMIEFCSNSVNSNPLTREGPPRVMHQNMFGEMGALTLTIEWVTVILMTAGGSSAEVATNAWLFDPGDRAWQDPSVINKDSDKTYINVGRPLCMALLLAFRFLRQVIRENETNQSMLAEEEKQHGFLASHLLGVYKANDVYGQLFKNNLELLSRMTNKQVKDVVHALSVSHSENKRGARFVDLLGLLCTVHDIPLPRCQNKVFDEFMVKTQDGLCAVNFVESGRDGAPGQRLEEPEFSMPSLEDPSGFEFIPVAEFKDGDQDLYTAEIFNADILDCKPREKQYRYYIRTLHLFTVMCQGRNRNVADFILKNVDTFGVHYKKLLGCLRSDRLPAKYRGCVVALIRALYIDREPNEYIPPLSYIRIWKNVKPQVELESQWKKTNPWATFPNLEPTAKFSDLRIIFQDFFTSSPFLQNLDTMPSSQNELMLEFVKTMLMLLEFGMYVEKGATGREKLVQLAGSPGSWQVDGGNSSLLGCMVNLLGFGSASAMADTENASFQMLVSAKMNAVKIVTYIFDCRQEYRLQILFERYDSLVDHQVGRGALQGLAPGGKSKQGPHMPTLTETDIEERGVNELRKDLFETNLLGPKVAKSSQACHINDFVQNLLVLTTYEHADFVRNVFGLLFRHYEQPSLCLRSMEQQQIIVMDDIAASVPVLTHDVSEVRRCLKWISAPADAQRAAAYKTVPSIVKYWTNLMTPGQVVNWNNKDRTITRVEAIKFQNILQSLGAAEICYQYLKISVEANIMEPSEQAMEVSFVEKLHTLGKAQHLIVDPSTRRLMQKSGAPAPKGQNGPLQVLDSVEDVLPTKAIAIELRNEVLVAAGLMEFLNKADSLLNDQDYADNMTFASFYTSIVKSFQVQSEPQFKHLLMLIMKFLMYYVKESPRNQRFVRPMQELWTQLVGVPGLDSTVAELMTAVITGNADLTDDIPMSWLEQVMRHVTCHKESQWIQYLNSAVCTMTTNEIGKADFKPHLRAGTAVMRGVLQLKFMHIFQTENEDGTVTLEISPPWSWKTLDQQVQTVGVGLLDYHFESMHLFAALCEGSRPEHRLMTESAIPWQRMLEGVLLPMHSCRWVAEPLDDFDTAASDAFYTYSPPSVAAMDLATMTANVLHPDEDGPLDVVLSNIFDRYDLDNSGTINSNEELRNMIIYACYRLQTDPHLSHRATQLMNASDNVDNTIAQGDLPPRLDLSLAEWQIWFRLQVLKVRVAPTAPTARRLVTPAEPSAIDTATYSDPKMDDFRIYALRAKRAYLKLLTNVMLNTELGTTPTALTRQDANLWPDVLQPTNWNLTWHVDKAKHPGEAPKCQLPTTLMEEALAAIRTLLEEPPRDMPRSGELLAELKLYVFEAVVPFLHLLWSQHFSIVDATGEEVIVPEIQRMSYHYTAEWTKKLYGMELKHRQKGEPSYLRILEELLQATGQSDYVARQRMAVAETSNERVTPAKYFKEGWSVFSARFAGALNIEAPFTRQLGLGLRDLSLILTSKYTEPMYPPSPERSNTFIPTPRHVMFKLFETLQTKELRSGDERGSPELARNLLRVARCAIYLDDPHLPRPEGFMETFPSSAATIKDYWCMYKYDKNMVKMEDSAKTLSWVQNKYVGLGAHKVLNGMMSHHHPPVRTAALRFGMACLEGQCRLMQNAMLEDIQENRNHDVIASFFTMIVSCRTSMKKFLVVYEAGTSSTCNAKMVDIDAFDFVSHKEMMVETKHTLSLLIMFMNRNLDTKNFIREQTGNAQKYDLLSEVGNLLEVLHDAMSLSLFEWTPTLTSLLDRALGFVAAATEGPCSGNQLALSRNVSRTLNRMLSSFSNLLKEELTVTVFHHKRVLQAKVGIYVAIKGLLDSNVDSASVMNIGQNLSAETLLDDIVYPTRFDDDIWATESVRNNLSLGVQAFMGATVRGVFFRIRKNWFDSLGMRQQGHVSTRAYKNLKKDGQVLREVGQEVSLEAYCILKYLGETLQSHRSKQQDIKNLPIKVKSAGIYLHQYLEDHTAWVEVLRDDAVHRIYFAVPAYMLELQKITHFEKHASDEMVAIDREDPDLKAIQLSRKWLQLRDEAAYYKILIDNPWTLPFLEYYDICNRFPFQFAVVQLICIIVLYGDKKCPFCEYAPAKNIVGSMTFVQLAGNVIKMALYFLIDAPVRHIGLDVGEDDDAFLVKLICGSMDGLASGFDAMKSGVDMMEDVFNDDNEKDREDSKFANNQASIPCHAVKLEPPPVIPTPSPFWLQVMRNCVNDSLFWQNGATLSLAFYIMISGDEANFWIAFLLFDYFRQPAGVDILRSVMQGGEGLINAFTAGFILVIAWACLSFQLFQDQIQGNNECRSAFQCISQGINEGLHGDFAGLHGTDFDDIMPAFPLKITDNLFQFPLQWLFVITFFLIWEFIVSGIVQGQIVDAFSEMRAKDDMKKEDEANFCLICSLDRFTLDKVEGGFRDHVETDHNPWDYLYAYASSNNLQPLKAMNPMVFHRTGMMTYLQDCIESSVDNPGNIAVPVKRCFEIKDDLTDRAIMQENHETMFQRLEALENNNALRIAQLESDMHNKLDDIMEKIDAGNRALKRSGSSTNLLG